MPNNVLMVEDEPIIGDVLEMAFEDAGFHTCRAYDGSEAFAALGESAGQFCAVITDIRLGAGADGWEIARHARDLQPEIPIIYISGHAGTDWRNNGVARSLFLSKPFLPSELVSAALSLIDASEIRSGRN
jgi:two-component system cell cycle response regulator CpdR